MNFFRGKKVPNCRTTLVYIMLGKGYAKCQANQRAKSTILRLFFQNRQIVDLAECRRKRLVFSS